ncbi:transcription termination/antitermination protein NusA [Candidatus Curtissbacteria bacterium]|nr:transcription termination/antitermination protein NusA [Candidatus Curtissbacteria bacterium]
MAIQQRSEFASALNQVCSERGIEPEVVIDSIKQAVLAAYRKDYEEPEGIDVEVNADSGEVTLKKGKKLVTPPGFGRIAAQTAKQVILQRIREAEKDAVMSEYSGKVGTIVSGIVQRISGPIITVNLGKAEGIMPPSEQARGEKYFVNQRLKLFVVGIKEGTHGEEIIVSRSANGLLESLFRQEVPEMASGAVEVKAMAREAGSRSKIAVWSGQLGVDPVGSCVGQKGVRVQAVINELGSEKIDVIAYQEDPAEFIKAALSPAKDLQVKIEEDQKTAEVTAPDDQLSLAIGKEGQNVRLAAKLTGYRIDIRGKTGTPKEVEAKEKAAQEEAKKALGVTEESKEPEEPKEEGTTEASSATGDRAQTADDQNQPVPEPPADDPSRQVVDEADKRPLIADTDISDSSKSSDQSEPGDDK